MHSIPMNKRPDMRSAASAALGTPARRLAALGLGCLALAALSLLLPSTPTYDPWAWIIWGREVIGLELDTRTGPSWKPLPVLFTTVFAPAGDAAPALWLVVARGSAMFALVMAFRVASRLAGRGAWAPLAGGVAAATLLLSSDWFRNAALGNSEGLLVATVLWGVERHLDGRRDHAFALLYAAGLLRPEIWPFLGLYGLWLFVREPARRRLVVACFALLPVLWLGPELWGSGDPLRASSRANDPNPDSPAFAAHPALEVFLLAWKMLTPPVFVAAVVALGMAFSPRDRRPATVALAAGALGWVAIVAAMTEGGYAGNTRYLVLYASIFCVLAGVGTARLVHAAGPLLARGLRAVPAARAQAALACVVVAVMASFSAGSAIALPGEVREVGEEARADRELELAVREAGGPERLRACGSAATGAFEVPALAWKLRVPVSAVSSAEASLPGVLYSSASASMPVPRVVGGGLRRVAGEGRWRLMAACGRPSTDVLASADPLATGQGGSIR